MKLKHQVFKNEPTEARLELHNSLFMPFLQQSNFLIISLNPHPLVTVVCEHQSGIQTVFASFQQYDSFVSIIPNLLLVESNITCQQRWSSPASFYHSIRTLNTKKVVNRLHLHFNVLTKIFKYSQKTLMKCLENRAKAHGHNKYLTNNYIETFDTHRILHELRHLPGLYGMWSSMKIPLQ